MRSIRLEKGLSQYQLGHLAGISSQYVGYIEREIRCPTVATLARISIGLDVPADEIVRKAAELAAKSSK